VRYLHLTDEEKVKHLEKLLGHYDADEDLVDLDFIPLLAKFTMIKGVCPVESCTGHKTAMWELVGYLSLAFSERMYLYFIETCLNPLLHMHSTLRVKINVTRDWKAREEASDFSLRPHIEISWNERHWRRARDEWLPRLAETLRQHGGSE